MLTNMVDTMPFDDLIELARALGIDDDHEHWLHDEFIEREDDLRVQIMEMIDKANEKGE